MDKGIADICSNSFDLDSENHTEVSSKCLINSVPL